MTWEEERHRDLVAELTRKYGREARMIVPVLAEELDEYVAQLRKEGWKLFPIDTWHNGIVIQATREVRVGTAFWGHDERQDFEFRTTAREFMHYPEWLRKTGRKVNFREENKHMKLIEVKLTRYDIDGKPCESTNKVRIPASLHHCPAREQLHHTISMIEGKGWNEVHSDIDESPTSRRCLIKYVRADEALVLSWLNPHYSSVAAIIE